MPWSAWQSPWNAQWDISQTGKYFRYLRDFEGDASSTAAIAPMAATAKATINSGGGTAGPSAGSFEVLATTQAGRFTGATFNTQVTVEFGYSAAVFDGASAEAFAPSGTPPALAALTVGVDYTTIPPADVGPNTVGFVDYEGPGQSFAQWDVLHGDMTINLSGNSGAATLLPTPIPVPLRFWGYTAMSPHAGNATAGPALGYAPSNVIGDVDFAADFAHSVSGNFSQDVGSLDLSTQSEAFTLVMQCRWQGAVDVLTDEIVSGPGHGYTLTVYARDVPTARALYSTPRWRYWIPETTAGWHTVGGHWSTVGGAELKRLTPTGSGPQWLPVLDGPA